MAKEVKIIEPTKKKREKAGKLRVAAYCRVSTDDEEQENSLRNQIRYYTELIQNDPRYELVEIYADQGISGGTDRRPEFLRMIHKATTGGIDIIFTKSISRFSRNVRDLNRYTAELKSAGVNVIFEEEHIDLLSSEGTIFLTILGSIAQMEIENTSSHISHTLQSKMKHGELVGQPDPYGYSVQDGKLVIDEAEARVVRYIFERYIDGVGGRTIARELTQQGIPTKRGNKTWRDSVILDIIKNEKYTGTLIQGKTATLDPISKIRVKNDGVRNKYIVEDNHPAIIDKATFQKAQDILSKRIEDYSDKRQKGAVKRFSHSYTFSSMIVCGYCGANYSRRSIHAGTPSHRPIWQCQTYIRQGKSACPECKAVNEIDIEEAFQEILTGAFLEGSPFFFDINNIEEMTKKQKKEVSKLEEIQKSYEANKQTIARHLDRILDAYIDGVLTREQYELRKEKEEINLKDIEKKIKKITAEIGAKKEEEETRQTVRKMIQKKEISEFNPEIFKAMVAKVVIGGIGKDPKNISFIFRPGVLNSHSPDVEFGERDDEEKGGGSDVFQVKLQHTLRRWLEYNGKIEKVLEYKKKSHSVRFDCRGDGSREYKPEEWLNVEIWSMS